MAGDRDVLVHVADMVKHYQALRPLRVKQLHLRAGQSVALHGLDKTAAEVLVNVLTGASLPDAGTISVFGRATADIADTSEWWALLRRFALLSDRTVLVEQLTVEQNLAIPHTLCVDPLPDDVRHRVHAVASEVGLDLAMLNVSAAALRPLDVVRVRLGRALALDAEVLLAEHPTAPLSPDESVVLAKIVHAAVAKRGMAAVYVTVDEPFCRAVKAESLKLKPATGELVPLGGWLSWLPGRSN